MENAAQLASLNESVQTSGGSLVVALAKDLAAKEGLLTETWHDESSIT